MYHLVFEYFQNINHARLIDLLLDLDLASSRFAFGRYHSYVGYRLFKCND